MGLVSVPNLEFGNTLAFCRDFDTYEWEKELKYGNGNYQPISDLNLLNIVREVDNLISRWENL